MYSLKTGEFRLFAVMIRVTIRFSHRVGVSLHGMECMEIMSGSQSVGTSRLVTCRWHISCDTKAFYMTVNANIRRHRCYAYFSPAVDDKFSGA